MFQTSIDWIEFTIPADTLVNETVTEIRYYLDSEFVSLDHGSLGYENLMVGIGGSKVLTSSKRPEHHVILPGKWCRAVGFDMCTVVLAWVLNHNGHFTRLDLAGDDYSKSVLVERVAKACKKGELVSHCHDAKRTHDLRGKPQDGIYIGSPSSRRRLRIYDKDKESNGEIDSIRWELQLRDEAADHAALLVLDKPFQHVFESLLVGLADFRQASKGNSTRRKRTNWFKKLVGEVRKAKLALPQPIKSVENMELWLRRQVSPTLAAVIAGLGGDLAIVDELITEGRKHWKAAHRIAIAEALKARSRLVADPPEASCYGGWGLNDWFYRA